MKMKGILTASLACMLLPGIAMSTTLNVGNSNLNGNVVTDFSFEGRADIEFFIANPGVTILTFDLTPGEMAAGSLNLAINSIVQLPAGVSAMTLSVGGANSIGLIGDAFFDYNVPAPITATANSATLTFSPPELSQIWIGEHISHSGMGEIDWVLEFPTTASSIKLSISVKEAVVPLPAGIWLLLSVLPLLGVIRRR